MIYYFHDLAIPVFALTAFAKNERADLSPAERNDFRRLTKVLADAYGRKRQ